MKVILVKDIENVGKARQIVDVKSGYANNYLFKNRLAVAATDENMQKLEAELLEIEKTEAEIKRQAELVRDLLKDKTVMIKAKSGPEGRLYGAVTSKDIAVAIEKALGKEIDKRKLVCDNIKETGSHIIAIKLHPQVEAQLEVIVESEK